MSKQHKRSKLKKKLRNCLSKQIHANGNVKLILDVDESHINDLVESNKNVHHKEWHEMEFVIKIFEFVEIEHSIINISLVCKQWHKFSLHQSLWSSLMIDSKMITKIHTFSIKLNRWKRINTLSIYVGLDINLFRALEVLEKMECECHCSQIMDLSLHVFGFDDSQIIDRILYCIKKLMVRNHQSIKRLSMEFGHGLTVSCLPNPQSIAFEHITHLMLERIGLCRIKTTNLWSSLFPNITHLSINYAGLTESDFRDFSKCQRIKFLSIFMLEHDWMTVTKTIEILSLFPNIIGLQLEYPRFEANNHFFEQIAIKLPKIEVLYFWWWSLTQTHFDIILHSFANLKKLGFAYSSISTKYIEKHPLTQRLEKIGLYGNLWDMNTVNVLEIEEDEMKMTKKSKISNVYIENADKIATLFS